MAVAQIDIFSDPVCPWCLVGLTRLNNAIARYDTPGKIGITLHPFLLDANTPKEGEDVVAMLKRKYGRSPDEMWNRLESEAKSCGLALDMRKQKWRYPSQKALALIGAAEKKGTQFKLALALSEACYMAGENIADLAVLQRLGVAHGFSDVEVCELVQNPEVIKEVEQKAKWAPEAGITGVPFFVFNNTFVLSGAQPEAVFDAALKKILEPAS
jgi:predicted DsbA family dithiol-disulfide isomerase